MNDESTRAMEGELASRADELRSLAKTLQIQAAATALPNYRDKFLSAAMGLLAAAEALETSGVSD